MKACLPACLEPLEEAAEEASPVVEDKLGEAVEAVGTRGSELARNIQQSGTARQVGEAAHHIVAQAARAAAPAREALARVGVRINEAANGVFLPATRDYVGQAVNHLTMHTRDYYNAVNTAVQGVASREEAIQVLQAIKDKLLSGSFP